MFRRTWLYTRKVVLVSLFLFEGCANITFNAQMCDPKGSDGQNVPASCYAYSEEEAAKASKLPKEEPCNACSKPKELELNP